MLAHIWNEYHVFPDEVYNKPDRVKEFIYQATELKIKREQKAARRAKGGR